MDAWRSWPPERLEREYLPSSVLDSIDPFLRAYAERSREALTELEWRRDLRYGPGEDDVLDLAPAGPDAPLLVFFHGGYWQELGKADALFPAPGLVAHGIGYAAVEYTLAPQARLDGIVDQARRSVAFLARNAGQLGIDADRIHVAGHSAGAQLAAMTMLSGRRDPAEPAPKPRVGMPAGGVLVSGVYDLEPLIGTSINDALGLDVETARRNSPLLLCGARAAATAGREPPLPPLVVCWGEIEPSEFGRQGREFSAAWSAAGGQVDQLEVARRNHFDILFDLADATTALGRSLRDVVLGRDERQRRTGGGPARSEGAVGT